MKAFGDDEHNVPAFHRLFAAIFYGVSSILVIFTNKIILTYYSFPFFDFLAAVQFLATTLILTILILLKRVEIPALNWGIFKEIMPITIMFLGNVLCGLGSTKSLNIPMFTALRRFSILMTMLAEWGLLGAKPSSPIIYSILLMVGGSLLAAIYDLTFDWNGYTMVFLNNVFTALNGVWMKKASMSGKCSKMGVLFYNSLFSGIIMISFFLLEHQYMSSFNESSLERKLFLDAPVSPGKIAQLRTTTAAMQSASSNNNAAMSTINEIYNYPGWANAGFLMTFLLGACMGSILNYSIFLCTSVNSALTTAVIGAMKNVATAYIGMVAFPDYAFSWVNFLGINVSIAGSLYYTYLTIFKGVKGLSTGGA